MLVETKLTGDTEMRTRKENVFVIASVTMDIWYSESNRKLVKVTADECIKYKYTDDGFVAVGKAYQEYMVSFYQDRAWVPYGVTRKETKAYAAADRLASNMMKTPKTPKAPKKGKLVWSKSDDYSNVIVSSDDEGNEIELVKAEGQWDVYINRDYQTTVNSRTEAKRYVIDVLFSE